jgi:alpha-tubulin suppressor-like RCC1 family protein
MGVLGYDSTESIGDDPGTSGNSTSRTSFHRTIGEMPPPLVNVGDTVSMVVGGGTHTCAVTSSKKVVCWGEAIVYHSKCFGPASILTGSNGSGQCGIAAGRAYLSIGSDPGPQNHPMPPLPAVLNETIRSISLGQDFTCAVTEDFKVYCWGTSLPLNYLLPHTHTHTHS